MQDRVNLSNKRRHEVVDRCPRRNHAVESRSVAAQPFAGTNRRPIALAQKECFTDSPAYS